MSTPGLCTVLPVKRFEVAKARLAPQATDADRAQIARRLFRRTASLVRACQLDPVVVVTRDEETRRDAEAWGWIVLEESGHSHSAAVAQAAAWAARHGLDGLFALSCDLPLLSRQDVRRMIRWAGHRRLVLAPDRLGLGTNALLACPPDAIGFHFGPDSLRKHLAAATEGGLEAVIHRTPGLAVDLDEGWDLDLVAGAS